MGIGTIGGADSLYLELIDVLNGIGLIMETIKSSEDKRVLKNGAWVLSILCFNRELKDAQLHKEVVEFLCSRFCKEEDSEVLVNIAWCLAWVPNNNDMAQVIVSAGVIPVILQVLE